MSNINLNNLSPNLYQEAVKAAKENKITEKMDYLVNLASEKGFTTEEKLFLEGLASQQNIDKLKNSDSKLGTIDFIDPGFNFSSTSEQAPIPKGALETVKQMFNNYAVQPLKNVETGVVENTSQVLIRRKIDSIESIGKNTLENLSSKLPSASDQTLFINLYKNSDAKTKENLKFLIESKDAIPLSSQDSMGRSIMQNLNALNNITKNATTGEKVDGKLLAQQAIAMLKDDKNILQGDHGTCGAGSTENYMRDNYPSELVRIVKDLALVGHSTLADGKFDDGLTLPKGALNYKEKGRNQFDCIFQSAIMQKVALVGGDERATMLKTVNIHEAEYDVAKDDGSAEAVKTGDSAADPYLLNNLLNRMMKDKTKFETKSNYNVGNLFGKDVAMDAVKSTLAKNKEAIVCFKYDGTITGSRHYVVVNDIKKDPADNKEYVYFKNTADPYHNKMELKEFSSKLEFTIHPKK